MKKINIPKHKTKEATWRMFSKYIRTRDCLATTGFADQGKCVTCGKYFPYSELQAGHAIPGRSNVILFDEELVNGQCKSCNMGGGYGRGKMGYNSGRYAEYSVWFIKRYGADRWEEKVRISKTLGIDLDYDMIYNKYKKKYEKLLS